MCLELGFAFLVLLLIYTQIVSYFSLSAYKIHIMVYVCLPLCSSEFLFLNYIGRFTAGRLARDAVVSRDAAWL